MLDEGCPSGRTGTLHAIAVSSGQRIFIWSLQQKLNDSAGHGVGSGQWLVTGSVNLKRGSLTIVRLTTEVLILGLPTVDLFHYRWEIPKE